jgi:integrase
VLSSILSLAVRDKRLAANPATGVNLPRPASRRRRYLTADDVERFAVEAARRPHLRVGSPTADAYRSFARAVYVLANCGLRWSELAALRVEHVDLLRRRRNVAEGEVEPNGGCGGRHGKRRTVAAKHRRRRNYLTAEEF